MGKNQGHGEEAQPLGPFRTANAGKLLRTEEQGRPKKSHVAEEPWRLESRAELENTAHLRSQVNLGNPARQGAPSLLWGRVVQGRLT